MVGKNGWGVRAYFPLMVRKNCSERKTLKLTPKMERRSRQSVSGKMFHTHTGLAFAKAWRGRSLA